MKIRQLLALSAGVFLAVVAVPKPSQAADPVPGDKASKPEINVLLLGYYIWSHGYTELAKKEGINIVGPLSLDPTGSDPKNYPVDFLKKFHVVIASGPLEKPWDPQIVRGGIKPGVVDNLLEYNRQGGGLVWTPLGAGFGADAWNESIGKRIGATALNEALSDGEKEVPVATIPSLGKRLRYTWTTDIKAHPTTAGVRGLFFGREGEWGWPGTIPMQFGPDWNVLVRGMASTRTTRNATIPGSGERGFKYTDQTGTYPTAPQLMAVRQAAAGGKGRMLVQPIYTTWTWGNYGHPAMKEAFLFNGDGTHPSDGHKFLTNSWRWLAQPALDAGDFGGYTQVKGQSKPMDLSPVKWNDADLSKIQASPGITGLIGAQTAQGGGKGTVAEWATAARAAGLDYLIFTDDPAKHTDASYADLIAQCKAQSDAKFAAVPGFGANDINGVFRFFPDAPHLPSKKTLDDQGRILKPAGIVTDFAWTVGQVPGNMSKMPYNPWWEHVNMACAPLTYDGDKLTDDSVMRWLTQCEPNQTNLLPMSLVHLTDPAQLASAAKNVHKTVFRTTNLGEIKQFAKTGAGGQVMPSYLTNGPVIGTWFDQSSQGEPFRPNSSRFRIFLKTSSDVGLAQVRLIDAATGADYRVFKPAGQKEFGTVIDENTSDQRVIGLIVTDVNGRTAIAPPVYTLQGANRLWQMGDRLMGLQHTSNWDEKRENLISFGTPNDIPYHKGSPDGGGEFTTNHISGLKFQGLEGSGIYPPAFKIVPQITTNLGTEPRQMSMRYTEKLASHDLTVLDYLGTEQYVENGGFVFENTPRAMQPTTVADIVSRTWTPRIRYNAPVNMMINEITVTFKKDANLTGMMLARFRGQDAEGEFNVLTVKPGAAEPAEVKTFAAGEKYSKKTDFTPGGYLYQGPALAGTMGFVALDDKVSVRSGARGHEFVLNSKYLRNYTAGEKLQIRFLRVARKYDDSQSSAAWLDKFLKDYGVAKAPGYSLTLTQGKLRESNYVAEVDSQDGGAAFTVGQLDLPEPLPVRVWGVSANAVYGEYDLETGRVRPLPDLEGSVTTTIETQLKSTKLYVGEWLRWDNPAARVSVVSQDSDFLVELHNPTGKEISLKLQGAPGFLPLKGYNGTFQIAANSSVKVRVPAVAGSVNLVPLR